MDTGAERTCVTETPPGCFISQETLDICGANGESFPVPVIKNVTFSIQGRTHTGDILYLPQAGISLLGHDFQIPLRVGVVPQGGKMTTKLFVLSLVDEQHIDPVVRARPGNRGKMDITPLTTELLPNSQPVRVPQYPLSKDKRKGLKPVIMDLLRDGILETCKSTYNTPILAVQKPDKSFRLVQDLREVNKRVQTRYPLVQDPYTLLSRVPPTHAWFSVIDLKDAFWSCPLDSPCRDIFAFTWEDPDTDGSSSCAGLACLKVTPRHPHSSAKR